METGIAPFGSSEAHRRVLRSKRLVFRAGAIVVFALGGLSWLVPQRASVLMGLHLLWALHLAVLGELVWREALSVRRAGLVSSLGGVLLLPAILMTTGQVTHGVLYPVLVSMPLMVAAVAPEDRTSVLVFAVAGVGWLIGLEVFDGEPPGHVVAMAGVSVACSVIAVLATLSWERTKVAEQQANAERLAALARLAESEQARLRAERHTLMAHVSGGLAHEMNNPLSYVCSNVHFARERLQERGLLEADLAEALSDTEQGLARISLLVRQMQDFAPLIGEQFEYGQCPEAVEAALARAASRLSVFASVEKKVSTPCPRVALSQHRLVEVLHHLVVNAADAASADGHRGQARLWLTVKDEPPAQVRIVVEDSGAGLSAEALARLFEPFFTTRPAGTAHGLGLALCREHVERAGGTIHAENRAEGGARFVIVLPVAPTR